MSRITLPFAGVIILASMLLFAVPAGAQTPSIVATPETTPPGGEVTITGNGFAASATLAMHTLTSRGLGLKLTDITASADGMFEASITVPGFFPAGPLPIAIVTVPDGNELARTTVTVTDAPSVASETLRIEPASGPAGTRFVATGTGFTPNATLVGRTVPSATGPQTPDERVKLIGPITAGGDGSVSIEIDSTGFPAEQYDLVLFYQGETVGFPIVRPPVYTITAPGAPNTGDGGAASPAAGNPWQLTIMLALAGIGIASAVAFRQQRRRL